MARCPICGEETSSLDRQHMKTKHPEYFRESRKWWNASLLSVVSMATLGMMFTYYNSRISPDLLVTRTLFVLTMVNVAIVFYMINKVIRLVGKYRESLDLPT